MVRGCAAPVLATSLLAGCISQTTVIRVRTDGSGTLTQTIAVRSEMARMMRDMRRDHEQGRSNQPPAPRGGDLFPESQARALAAELGKDVTFLSSEPLKARDVEGIKATYAFRDLEALRVVQEPSPPGLAEMPAADLGSPASVRQPLTFRFDRRADGHSVVTVVFPPPMGTSEAEASEGGGEPGGAGPLTTQTQFLKGLRITVVLEVDGTLLGTNSPYTQGSSVTLTDVDFDVLLADSRLLWRLKGATDLETAKWVLKDIKGMKVHLDPVTVEFAGK